MICAKSNEVEIKPLDKRWLGSPVSLICGKLKEVKNCIPKFERRPFSLDSNDKREVAVNEFQDMIVREPLRKNGVAIPVGIVSKKYKLIQHTELIESAIVSLKKCHIEPFNLNTEVLLTKYGERMALSVFLPKNYQWEVGKKDAIALRLECFNSVEGSTRFIAFLGWLRFVCLNGMIVGDLISSMKSRHIQTLEIEKLVEVIEGGIETAHHEVNVFRKWQKLKIAESDLVEWANGYLKKQWGVKAAARTYFIYKTAKDGKLSKPFEKGLPTEKTIEPIGAVPGVEKKGNNIFNISQILSWLSRDQNDFQDQIDRKSGLSLTLQPLLEKAA